MLFKTFSEETKDQKLGKKFHEGFVKRKKAYVQLVKSGHGYDDIQKILKIQKNTLTKYALETNFIPALSKTNEDFDRNLLYHCIREYDVWIKKKEDLRIEHQKAINEKKKYRYDPDWWMR